MNNEESVVISVDRLQELLACEVKLAIIENVAKTSKSWELESVIKLMFALPEEKTDA